MNEYLLRLRGSSSMLQWETRFNQPTDAMAKDYARRALCADPAARVAMSAELFNMDTTNQGLIAIWTIERLTSVIAVPQSEIRSAVR